MSHKSDYHHQPKSEENISSSRTSKRAYKRELDSFRVKISNQGGVYDRISKLLKDVDVNSIRSHWYNKRYHGNIDTYQLSDSIDEWLNNIDDVHRIKRSIKLELLLEQ